MTSKFASFPFPLRVGTDICQLSRIRRILNGNAGAQFIRRILTEEERTAASSILGPIMPKHIATAPGSVHAEVKAETDDADTTAAARFVAGRFAAKEAVFKATPERIGFQDVVVRKKPSGQPFAILKATGGTRQDREVLLSISHDGDYATAVAIAALEEAWPRESEESQ